MATVSVAWVRYLGANLVEVVFGLPSGKRVRCILPRRYTKIDDVQFIGRALAVLMEQGQVPA